MENHDTDSSSLDARAACLINPASGIANDYLNIFNEILLLIENMPVLLPEMIADLKQWKSVGYREYFENSPLPGSGKALAVYDSIDPSFRARFEEQIARVSEIANESRDVVLSMQDHAGDIEPDLIDGPCTDRAALLREALSIASDLVNNGAVSTNVGAQAMADQLMMHTAAAPST